MKRKISVLMVLLILVSTLSSCANSAETVNESYRTEQLSALISQQDISQLSSNTATLENQNRKEFTPCFESELIQILKGATLLAAGGGGSYSLGESILNEFKIQNPEETIYFELYDPAQMDPDESTYSVAIMGSPTAHASAADLSRCALLAYSETTALAERFGKNPQYAIALELGGANTLIPLLCAIKYSPKVLDADLCGRAVPGLETMLSSINGLPTAPFALTDSNGNSYDFIMSEPCDAAAVESSAVAILNHLQTNGGVTGYYYSSGEVINNLPTHTLTRCLRIGQTIEAFENMTIEERQAQPLFNILNEENQDIRCVTLTEKASPVFDFHQEPAGGGARDKGYYYLGKKDVPGKYFYVQFNNESMAVSVLTESGTFKCLATAPCIIAMYDENTGMPLTNADLKEQVQSNGGENLSVVLGIIDIDSNWWKNPSSVVSAWQPYWEEAGYTGGLVRYPFN